MKKIIVLLVVAVLLLGCEDIIKNSGNTEIDNELTKVVIRLPEVPSSRSVGLVNAKDYTNYFEAFFRKDDNGTQIYYQASALATEEEIVVNIPIGTYDILLLAGYKHDSNPTFPLLLASSYVVNKNIILEQINEINMSLNTTDITITTPNNVFIADTFDIEIEINTKNPLIDDVNPMIYFTTSLSDPISTFSCDIISSEDNIWKFKNATSLTAPITPIEGYIGFSNTYCYPFNVTDGSHGHWCLASSDYLDLGEFFIKSINFIEGQTMPLVIMNIAWSNE